MIKTILLVITLLLAGCEKNMHDLENYEKDLIKDSDVFSQWILESKISYKRIKDFGVENVKANNSIINNFIWRDVEIGGDFKDHIFKNGRIIDSFLESSNFENVIFENVVFDNVYLHHSNFKNTKFINCHIKKISHWYLDKEINIEFIDSKIDKIGLQDLNGTISFKNTIAKDSCLRAKSDQNASIVNIVGGIFEGRIKGKINVNVKDANEMHAYLDLQGYGNLNITNTNLVDVTLQDANFINLSNIKHLSGFELHRNIKNSTLKNIDYCYAFSTRECGKNLGNIKISNAKIQRLALENFEGNLELENVKASLWDFNDSKIGTLKLKNVEMFYPTKSDFDHFYRVNRDPDAPYVFNFKNAKINHMVIDGYKHYPGIVFNPEGMVINKAIKIMPDNTELEISQQQVESMFN